MPLGAGRRYWCDRDAGRGLIQRDPLGRLSLTKQGRAALDALLMARFDQPIEPVTLGNMRANGVRSLVVSCGICHHHHRCRTLAGWCADGHLDQGIPTPRPRPPRSTADASRIARTLPESASQKPPIASPSAASPPSRKGEEHGGQLTRYKRRTNDPLPTTRARPVPLAPRRGLPTNL
jgi:hypothetical protein